MYVCICTYVRMYMYICTYVYVHMYVCICTYVVRTVCIWLGSYVYALLHYHITVQYICLHSSMNHTVAAGSWASSHGMFLFLLATDQLKQSKETGHLSIMLQLRLHRKLRTHCVLCMCITYQNLIHISLTYKVVHKVHR